MALHATVTWAASPTATSYTVYRSNASGTQGSSIGTTTTLTFTDSTVVPGSTYFYGVTASNISGEGQLSAQFQLVVPNVPAAPANVVATLGP